MQPSITSPLPRSISSSGAACLVAPFATSAVGLAAQSATYLNHDVAWVLVSSERLLDGGVFGRDIVAANPPLIWWLSSIPASVARVTELPPAGVFRAFVAGLAIWSLIAAWRLLRGVLSPWALGFVLTVAAYLFFFGIHRDFGQREHIVVLLGFPYVCLVACRMRGRSIALPLAVAVGIGAGIGFAFKPHLLLVPALLEGSLALRLRNPRSVLRPEVLSAVCMATAYAIAVILFARPWIAETAPFIASIYWGFAHPLDAVVLSSIWIIAAAGGLLALCGMSRCPAEPTLAAAAAIGSLAAALAQSKGYSYHLYPVIAFALIGFALLCAVPGRARPIAGVVVAAWLAVSALNSAANLEYRTEKGQYGAATAEIVDFVSAHVPPGGGFLAFSTHPYPGFPTALYADRNWAAATNSRLILPAIVRMRENPGASDPGLLQLAEQRAFEAARRDMGQLPDLVLVDARPVRHAIGALPFDFLAFYGESAWFRETWRHYSQVDGPPGFDAYVLHSNAGEAR